MNKTYLISADSIKTIMQGALGAMTFGAYHQFTTNKIIELNNEKQNIQHRIEMNELKEKIKVLEERKGWW